MADQTLAQGHPLSHTPLLHDKPGIFANEGVRVRHEEACLLCRRKGKPLYRGLRDRLFEAPGEWSLFACAECGFHWLSPQPLPNEISKLYRSYFTHGKGPEARKAERLLDKVVYAIQAAGLGYKGLCHGWIWSWIGRVGGIFPPLRDHALGSLLFLSAAGRGRRLLDVGCGDGDFLATMENLGWEVAGVEPDPKAAETGRQRHNLAISVGTLESVQLPPDSVDVITLSHVIEHVPSPALLLAECYRVLRPGGRLIALTPNVRSTGHALFRRAWFSLDPPRHLHLFSTATLRALAEQAGFLVAQLRTTSRTAREIFIQSCRIRGNGWIGWGSLGPPTQPERLGGWIFWFWEEVERLCSRGGGEELLLSAQKRIPVPTAISDTQQGQVTDLSEVAQTP